ncbi:hypothetical protein VFPPC_17602 [Pochonia chlamydosporia 170]|uniref:Uncharacterized protein n=1 Tax=Pochonia chlamydosporia 170 TaxID=1380566 RepID=A0A219ASR9_METCM|nr:hypothetical protein VFPPC_17602 [Pochonia chlamydosporia 170]OWT43235.1 hypothetical protein VFPPC_17602 [Pochonia chlamydosporia 170]
MMQHITEATGSCRAPTTPLDHAGKCLVSYHTNSAQAGHHTRGFHRCCLVAQKESLIKLPALTDCTKASQNSAHSSISYAPRQWRHRIEIPAANCVSLTTPTVWELKKQSLSKSRGLCRVLSVSSIHDAVIGSR